MRNVLIEKAIPVKEKSSNSIFKKTKNLFRALILNKLLPADAKIAEHRRPARSNQLLSAG